MINNNNIEASRGSQDQNTPQFNLPQIEPVINTRKQKTVPTSAIEWARISHISSLVLK